ncbi:MAG: hypothetical protein ACYCZH_12920 [Sulfuriferula sp.]
MNADYYAIRQLSPYRGMLFVVDIDCALAHSTNGHRWQVHCENPFHRYWPSGEWVEGEGGVLNNCQHAAAIIAALENHPPLPFIPEDTLELWLLDKARGLPLALLKTQRSHAAPDNVGDPTWYPFVLTDTLFTAHCLAEADARRDPRAWPVKHRDVLARQINDAARPLPAAQWFRRHRDGSGEGLDAGLRLEPSWIGRRLAASIFPELPVRERWSQPIQRELVREYHHWIASLLLTQPGLSMATRQRLEDAALCHPEQLLEVYRVLPEITNPARIHAALIATRLTQAASSTI